MSTVKIEATTPTMKKVRKRGQQRIVGKGRLRKRGQMDRTILAYRGMTFEQYTAAHFGRKLSKSDAK